MVKVKICGITNLADARASVAAGCDALGFVFYKKSPRYIAPARAAGIIRQLPKNIIKIGVFVNAREKTIRRIARLCRLDILQFHGSESPEFCRRFSGYKIIKAFRIKKGTDFKDMLRWRTFAYLFDTYVKSKPGGTGRVFNWGLITKQIDGIKEPVFLSGGLSEFNVKRAIEAVHPEWLDVSSSVESEPGRKDHKKIKRFIAAAKRISYVTR